MATIDKVQGMIERHRMLEEMCHEAEWVANDAERFFISARPIAGGRNEWILAGDEHDLSRELIAVIVTYLRDAVAKSADALHGTVVDARKEKDDASTR